MISEAAEAFISRCYHEDEIRITRPMFNYTYEINGKPYKFTQEVYQEIVNSGRVKITYACRHDANLMGIKGGC